MDFNLLVKSALSQYPIDAKKTYLLRHNENYTVKVIGGNNRPYVLRIHLSNNNMQGIGQHSYEALDAEMQIIAAINQNTDICTQTPVINNYGSAVSTLSANSPEIYATLLNWVPGEPLDIKNKDYSSHVYNTGQTLAKFHNFSQSWDIGLSLKRPKFDSRYLDISFANIKKALGIGLMEQKHLDMINEAMEYTKDIICELDESLKDNWYGITHCDVSNSNLIEHEGTITPIDFSLSCLNYFFFDLAGFISELPGDQYIKEFLAGYRTTRPLPKEFLHYIEVFFVQSIFGFMAMHVLNTNMHDWFERRLDAVCYDYLIPMINGERFLL